MWAVIVLDPPGLPWSCSWKLVLLHYVFSFCYIGLWIWTIFSVLKRTNLYRNPKNPEVSEQVCPTSRGYSKTGYCPHPLLPVLIMGIRFARITRKMFPLNVLVVKTERITSARAYKWLLPKKSEVRLCNAGRLISGKVI
ncbi:unnamed protein product [Calicophoron daubneyi]|uniref:Uncharacterized protein n=1 Tax=Calicophoron daubneyi TaxID=300641 RepID=A0AAV2T9N3_CALDB